MKKGAKQQRSPTAAGAVPTDPTIPTPTVVAAPVAVVLPPELPPPAPLPTPAPTAATIRRGDDHDRRKRPRSGADGIITWTRLIGRVAAQVIEWTAGIWIIYTGTHGRLFHEVPVTLNDIGMTSLGVSMVLGLKAFLAWIAKSPPATSPASPQPS